MAGQHLVAAALARLRAAERGLRQRYGGGGGASSITPDPALWTPVLVGASARGCSQLMGWMARHEGLAVGRLVAGTGTGGCSVWRLCLLDA